MHPVMSSSSFRHFAEAKGMSCAADLHDALVRHLRAARRAHDSEPEHSKDPKVDARRAEGHGATIAHSWIVHEMERRVAEARDMSCARGFMQALLKQRDEARARAAAFPPHSKRHEIRHARAQYIGAAGAFDAAIAELRAMMARNG